MIPGSDWDGQKEAHLFVLRKVFAELGYNDTQFLDFLKALQEQGYVIRPEITKPKVAYRNNPEVNIESHGR